MDAVKPRGRAGHRISQRVGHLVRAVVLYTILGLGCLVMLMPLIWMLSTASRPLQEVGIPEFILLPKRFVLWQNVQSVFTTVPMDVFMMNSAFVAAVVVTGRVLLCSLAGYSLAKFTYPGREVVFSVILSTMMIPFFVIVVPLFVLVHRLGWLNTYLGLIVPALVTAFGVFLMRQHTLGIPDELISAARIDGASEPVILARVILPLSGPALATLALLTFLESWDSYVWPLLVVTKKALLTVPLGLVSLRIGGFTSPIYWNVVMAGSLIALLPTYLVFLMFQRYFIEGVVLSGLKG